MPVFRLASQQSPRRRDRPIRDVALKLVSRRRGKAVRSRNDPLQYEELASYWWVADGPLAMLHWIAKERGALIPASGRPDSVLVDLGCGAGLLAPHITGKNYRHVGVDLNLTALRQAAERGVVAICADVAALPFQYGVADAVSAGEILEHVDDLQGVTAQACRILRPGGVLVLDTIASTRIARFLAIGVAERIPGGAPRGIHDPALFVDRTALVKCCASHHVPLALVGLRPSALGILGWVLGHKRAVAMRRTRSTAVLFQGIGFKEAR